MKQLEYNDIINITNIKKIYMDIRKNTKHKKKLMNYEMFLNANLNDIMNKLSNRNYIPKKYNIFKIKRPKERIILSQNLNDKIVNNLISKYYLNYIIEPLLIDANVATRLGKGTQYGIKKIIFYLHKLKNKHEKVYVLKCDIKKYFFNIDHDILLDKLKKINIDKNIFNLLLTIIKTTDNKYINSEISKLGSFDFYINGKGLPIGNMSSQIFAIFYLNELDHYLKEKLKVKYYVRYMDDFILMSHDKKFLKECINEINLKLKHLKLMLNNKTKIYDLDDGFNFLGYNFFKIGNKLKIKITNDNRYRIRRKLKMLKKTNIEKYNKSLNSYLGYFKCQK